MNAQSLSLLLVEDNPADAELLSQIMHRHWAHLRVTRAGSLADAVALAKSARLAAATVSAAVSAEAAGGAESAGNDGPHFDLVLLDLSLPDTSGLDTMRKAQALLADLPIIVLTGHDDEQVGLDALRAGAQDYLVKGRLTADSLFRAVRYAIERHAASQEILRSKEEWERTFDSVPDLIAVLDDHHHIIRANMAMATRLGCQPEDCVGKTCYSVVHGMDHPPAFCPHMQTLADGKEHTAEVREDSLGGDFLVSTTPVPAAAGIVGASIHVARDITDRKRKERDLAGLNRTLKALSDSNKAMMRATDELEYLRDVCRIVVEDCGHAMVWAGFAEDDAAKTIRPVAHAGNEAGYLGAISLTWADTERGQGPAGRAIRTGQVASCPNILADPGFSPWREQARKRGYASSIVFPLLDSTGKAFGELTIYSTVPAPFSTEEIALLCELAEDLTYGIMTLRHRAAHAQAERALAEAKEQLEQRVRERTAELAQANVQLAERAAQLRVLAGELTLTEQRERRRMAKVLHDHLQQLLVGAKFRTALLGRAGDELVRTGANEIAGLLDEAVAASRSLTAELSPPILHEGGLAAGLEWLTRWMADTHGLVVKLTVEPDLPTLAEDVKVLLFESIRELLFNAVKHAHVQSAHLIVRQVEGPALQVTVSDNGRGFDPDKIKPAGPTGGIGLFSIRERLELIGGRLDITSAPGEGSRFTLTAPLPEPEDSPAAMELRLAAAVAVPAAAAGSSAGRIRVLLVDDHEILRQGVARLLGQEPDMEVVGEACDGEEAVEMATRLRPHLILMDLSLPKITGIDATRMIRRVLPEVRVIGLSMFEEKERAHAMLAAGASAYLTKSGPAENLIATIRTVAGDVASAAAPKKPARPAKPVKPVKAHGRGKH